MPSPAENPSPPPSSSTGRTVPAVPYRPEKEEEKKKDLRALAGAFPAEFLPEPFCRRYESQAAVVRALEVHFEMPLPDALDLVGRYGVPACEGALLRTLAHMRGGHVRKPRGLVIWALRTSWAWTPEQVETYIRHEWEKTLERLEASSDVTYQRLARDLALALGREPENVVPLRREG